MFDPRSRHILAWINYEGSGHGLQTRGGLTSQWFESTFCAFIFFLWSGAPRRRRSRGAPLPFSKRFLPTNAFFSPFFFLDLGRESDSGKKLNPHPRYFGTTRKKVLRVLAPIRAPSRHSDKVKKRQKNKSTRGNSAHQLVWGCSSNGRAHA